MIAPRIRWALREPAGVLVLFEDPVLDPAASDRAFVLAMSDDVEAHVLPRMLQQLQAQELRVSVLGRRSNRYTAGPRLTEGSVDLVIGTLPRLPESFHREELLTSGYACLSDGDRPGLGTPCPWPTTWACRTCWSPTTGAAG